MTGERPRARHADCVTRSAAPVRVQVIQPHERGSQPLARPTRASRDATRIDELSTDPRASLGVLLTAGRSVAVDTTFIPSSALNLSTANQPVK
jgi:hypothetical protein